MRRLTPAAEEAVHRLLAAAMGARARGDGRPFVVGHFVTNRCMCSCASCLWKDNTCNDVPIEDLERFYLEAKDLGFVAAAFTGGEPFMRPDLGRLARFVKERAEMSILLFNTGWYLERRMDEVLPWIDMMIVSVDSAKPDRHDAIRGLPGLFDRMVRGVALARERYPGVSVHLNCCVQKGVADEIDDLVALAERLEVQISFDVITEQRNGGEGSYAETSAGLPLDELRAVCATLLEKKRGGAPILNSERYFEYFVDGRRGYRCHLPKVVMFVDGRGNAEYCLDLREPIANIRTTPLAEIVRLPRFAQLRVLAEGCSTCSSPTMVDLSHVWEDPSIALRPGGIAFG